MSSQKKPRTETDASDGPLDYVEEDEGHHDARVDSSEFIAKIRGVTDALDAIDKQAEEELHAVEERMLELYRPVYRQRAEILVEIPGFYRTIFANHPTLGPSLTETDHEILQHVVDMEVESMAYLKPSFSVRLILRDNAYIWNTELSKTFSTNDDGQMDVTGTAVDWKDGRGGQQLADGANGSNKRRLEEYSFFEWFEETTARLDNDYTNDSVCVAILQLWKRPEQYFLTEEDEMSEMDSEEPMVEVTSGDLVERTAHPLAGMYEDDTEYVETEEFGDDAREEGSEDLDLVGADEREGDEPLSDADDGNAEAYDEGDGGEELGADPDVDELEDGFGGEGAEAGAGDEALDAEEAAGFGDEGDGYDEDAFAGADDDENAEDSVYAAGDDDFVEEADAEEAGGMGDVGADDSLADESVFEEGGDEGDSAMLEGEKYAADEDIGLDDHAPQELDMQ